MSQSHLITSTSSLSSILIEGSAYDAEEYLKDIIIKELNFLNQLPRGKCTYSVKDNCIYQHSNEILSGWIYNSEIHSVVEHNKFTISPICFKKVCFKKPMLNDIQSALIRNRMRNMDIEALKQFETKRNRAFKEAGAMSYSEYLMTTRNLLETFQKKDYAQIVKSFMRFGLN